MRASGPVEEFAKPTIRWRWVNHCPEHGRGG
jgi:hypothetical protein